MSRDERQDRRHSGSARAVTGLRLIARGRVQGVGFRWFVMQAARECGVEGWVRNLPDGTVEVHAEGPRDAVEALAAAVRRGPRFSAVDGVERREMPPAGATGFEIRH